MDGETSGTGHHELDRPIVRPRMLNPVAIFLRLMKAVCMWFLASEACFTPDKGFTSTLLTFAAPSCQYPAGPFPTEPR